MQFKRIKDLREDNDLFQRDIANLLGISQQYYSEYESGKRTITISHLITLAKYYNVTKRINLLKHKNYPFYFIFIHFLLIY